MPPAQHGTFDLYNSTVTGLGVELQDWLYPVVADLETGDLKIDNYDGRWGEVKYLDQFVQMYTVEAATIAARQTRPLRQRTATRQWRHQADSVSGRWSMRTIEITVSPEGISTVETKGFVGN